MNFSNRYLLPLAGLNRALAAGDEQAFQQALDDMLALRESGVLADVQRLSDSLLAALARFRDDSRIAALAARDIPDARLRLDHVLKITEDAAHRTLDLIEGTLPLADRTVQQAKELTQTLDERSHNEIRAFLADTRGNLETVRGNLTEMMLTQGFQDLSGQILHSVQTLIGEVESVLGELAGITGARLEDLPEQSPTRAQGPAVPGVTQGTVSDQSDVDDMIARLGL